jgi:hypothetical protein
MATKFFNIAENQILIFNLITSSKFYSKEISIFSEYILMFLFLSFGFNLFHIILGDVGSDMVGSGE